MRPLLRKARLAATLTLLGLTAGIVLALGALLQLQVLQLDSIWCIAVLTVSSITVVSLLAELIRDPDRLPPLDTPGQIRRRYALPAYQRSHHQQPDHREDHTP